MLVEEGRAFFKGLALATVMHLFSLQILPPAWEPFTCSQHWPESYIYTVYDRIFGDIPAENLVYTLCVYIFRVLVNLTFTACTADPLLF